LEDKLKIKVDFKKPILRKFSIEEQNNWFAASDKVALAPFLSTEIGNKNIQNIDSYSYESSITDRTCRHRCAVENIKTILFEIIYSWKNLLIMNCWRFYLMVSGIRILKQRHIIFAGGFGCMPILILSIYH
jgi:hypothetical protein